MGSNQINKNPHKIQRVGSQICPSPNEELLEAILNNEELKVERVLRNHPLLLSYQYEDHFNNTPLLIACSRADVRAETVQVLLNQGADVLETNMEGWQALHCAAKKAQPRILEMILVKYSNIINNLAGGLNALQILIRYGNPESSDLRCSAKLLIDKGINLNHADKNNRTALYWAKKKNLDDIVTIIENALNSPEMNTSGSDKDYLLRCLKERREDDFISYGNIKDLVNETDTESTFLQLCCTNGLIKAANYLLEKGADPNRTYRNAKTPIELAVEKAYSEIIGILLNKQARLSTETLCTCIKDINSPVRKYRECYDILINYIKMQYGDEEIYSLLNSKDKMGYTPLHYAVRYASSDVIEELLSSGASLGSTGPFGVMPIEDIEPNVLEKHLDNCIIFDAKDKHWDKDSFKMEYNYRSLIPPVSRAIGTGSTEKLFNIDIDPEQGSNKKVSTFGLVEETKVIFFMSKEAEFKRFLKHPVITSYLFMKWWRVQYLFWLNFSFYTAFFLSLITYIFTDYADISPKAQSSFVQFLATISYIVLCLTLILLYCRELFQLIANPRKYVKSFENYIEIILIGIVTVIVFCVSSSGMRKQLSAVAILLASFELVLLLGQHPFFSTNVVMLKTVSFNFFKFLTWYSILLLAFALSFFLVFIPPEPAEKTESVVQMESVENRSANDDGDENFFDSPYRSVFKTIIMLTGEFDASSINFGTFPVTSKIIFAMFIFMIAIILLNLLNGLAVSDTQMIKNDAELVSYVTRAKYLQYVESMFFANVLPIPSLRKLADFCCCFSTLDIDRWSMRGLFAQYACLFPKYLQYRLVLYPNKRGLVELYTSGKRKSKCFACSGIYLDQETVRRTKTIIHTRYERENNDMKRISEELKSLKETLDSIIHILRK